MEVTVKRKPSMSRMALTKVVFFLLVLSGSAVAQSGNGRLETGGCSNHILFGDYGMQIEGIVLGPNLPLRTVSMGHFDGTGNLSEVSYVVLNGMIPTEEWRPSTATYTVNPNCTGVVTFNTPPGAPPLVFHFVLVKHGTEFRGVVDQSEITVNGYRVD